MDDNPRRFLQHFAFRYRGANSNLFFAAIRSGLSDPRRICSSVLADVRERLRSPYLTAESRENMATFLQSLIEDQEGALDLARECMEREALPDEARAQQKNTEAEAGRREWMRGQPPTEKQLAVLAKLGHTAEVLNRLDASELIEKLKTW